MVTREALLSARCRHTETALDESAIQEHLAALDGWSLEQGKIAKTFAFKNYYETLTFVNAAAYVFHSEDHHPELSVSYSRCGAKFDTHSVNDGRGGISENDFICAAKMDALYQQTAH
jgi:4a-hydroxytetrahydrobiopterin dehydratase